MSLKIVTLMPLSVAKKSEIITVANSATCAGVKFYGRLRCFSRNARYNCLVSKEDLTLGRKMEVFLLHHDSLWNNINGSLRGCVFDKQNCNSDSQSAECLTEHSVFYNDSEDTARLRIYSADFPCGVTLSFSKARGRAPFF